MKKRSITLKITLWYTALMILIVASVVSLILFFGDKFVEASAKASLIQSVTDVRSAIEVEETYEFDDEDNEHQGSGREYGKGKNQEKLTDYDVELKIDESFDFFSNGVYLSVYNLNLLCIYGRVPDEFDKTLTLQCDILQTVQSEKTKWYVYDTHINIKGYGKVWIRGVSAESDAQSVVDTMITAAIIALPFIVILAAFVGYMITRKAFMPIARIRESAEKISNGNDLTQRIALGKGKDEIYMLANTFDNMLDRLQHSFENEKQFTSDASHELRTPTAVIISQCEYAIENAQTLDEAKLALGVTLEQAKKVSLLISRLLELARTDKGMQKPVLERICISDLAEIVSQQQIDAAEQRNIEIKTEIEENVYVLADETLILRLLINLISNAIKYGKDGGHIIVRIYKRDKNIIGEVEDDGIGIADDQIDKIWERFYQVDTVRGSSSDNGIGLGLSMVKWIAHAHGGTVFVKSEFGKGSTFTFTIPE